MVWVIIMLLLVALALDGCLDIEAARHQIRLDHWTSSEITDEWLRTVYPELKTRWVVSDYKRLVGLPVKMFLARTRDLLAPDYPDDIPPYQTFKDTFYLLIDDWLPTVKDARGAPRVSS